MLLPRGGGVPKYNIKGKPQRPLLPLLLHGKDFFLFLGGGVGGLEVFIFSFFFWSNYFAHKWL